MHSAGWIALFQRIPRAQHDKLSVVTSIGVEISIQDVVRLEEDFVVVRGRLAGSTDAGRIYFVPYDEINFVGIRRQLREADVNAMFGGDAPAAVTAEATPDEEVAAAAEANGEAMEPTAEEAAEQPDAPVPEVTRATLKPIIPDKAALLQRLRTRSKAGMQRT